MESLSLKEFQLPIAYQKKSKSLNKNVLSDLELNERIKTSEEYDRKEEIIRSSYDRGLRNLYDDYKSLHLTFIYQGIWVIGSLLFVIVLMMVD